MRGARALWGVCLLLGFALDHIWILFDEHKQAWHDKIAGFYVVRGDAQPIAMVPMKRRLIGFMGYDVLCRRARR
jgi:uncharacterized RDD family membrane protein YckC